ncbi:DNA glycosylase AlkZ-like family protein [Micromonospora sp. SH-82]|uniref:DNA glycosylase AlkZ-like family protein n=1 Tax=Micromonospora sp. SH-82 TaxID=3132938 RepID=UPI003EBA478F
MSEALPDVTATHRLDADHADRLWQWLLTRQGVGSENRYESVPDVSHAALGLHAARLPSPFATVLARARDPEVALRLWHPSTHRAVTTVRCMRKTLHTLPLDLAAAAHAATLHYRVRDAARQIVNADLSRSLVVRTTAAIHVLLAEHDHLTHRQIEARLATGATPVVAVRLALKLAWEQGTLTYRNRSGSWNREQRTFALTATTHPHLNISLDRDRATQQLVFAYLDRYGPASLKDVTWWSGLSRARILAALDRAGHPLTALYTPWSPAPLYMFHHRFEEFTNTAHGAPAEVPVLLAHEDVALKAYAETRTRYLGRLAQGQVFNQIGEVLPTIVLGGRVIGTWAWDALERSVAHTVFTGCATAANRSAVRRAARRATVTLRQGYDDGPRRHTARRTTGGRRDW